MNRSASETWSITRSLAFLAATFAIVLGSLIPFAAMAASTPGHPIVICSAEGPQTIAIGVDGHQDDNRGMSGAKCAACVLSVAAPLPHPPVPEPAAVPTTRPASVFVARIASPRLRRVPPTSALHRPPHA